MSNKLSLDDFTGGSPTSEEQGLDKVFLSRETRTALQNLVTENKAKLLQLNPTVTDAETFKSTYMQVKYSYECYQYLLDLHDNNVANSSQN